MMTENEAKNSCVGFSWCATLLDFWLVTGAVKALSLAVCFSCLLNQVRCILSKGKGEKSFFFFFYVIQQTRYQWSRNGKIEFKENYLASKHQGQTLQVRKLYPFPAGSGGQANPPCPAAPGRPSGAGRCTESSPSCFLLHRGGWPISHL